MKSFFCFPRKCKVTLIYKNIQILNIKSDIKSAAEMQKCVNLESDTQCEY